MKKILNSIILILFIFLALFPIYWMIITSFKSNSELYSYKSPLLVQKIVFKNYFNLFNNTEFSNWILNSFFVSIFSTLISITISSLNAYSITRMNLRGGKKISLFILLFYLIPTSILFLPLHNFFASIGVNNSLIFLSIIYSTFLIPFSTWFLISFFNSIPDKYEKLSLVDGCSFFQSLIKVVLPLAKRGIIITSIFCFILSWNEYIYALVFLNDPKLKTLTIGISSLENGDVFEWGIIMAAGVIVSIPVVISFLIIQKYFLSGFTLGLVNRGGK